MRRKIAALAVSLLFLTIMAFPQQGDSVKVRLNHYSFTLGCGWTRYLNNLDIGYQRIQKDFIGISMKFFWEPEHLLSLGLETGYYKIFRTTYRIFNDTAFQVDRCVAPFLLLARMRVISDFYVGAGMGFALVTNKTTMLNRKIVTKTWSLSNFELSGAYIHPLDNRWRVGAEARICHYGNLNDWMISVQLLCVARL